MPYIPGTLPSSESVLAKMKSFDADGKYNKSADLLIDHMFDLMERSDIANMNIVMEITKKDLQEVIYPNDGYLARIVNLLAITRAYAGMLPARAELQSLFRKISVGRVTPGTLGA